MAHAYLISILLSLTGISELSSWKPLTGIQALSRDVSADKYTCSVAIATLRVFT